MDALLNWIDSANDILWNTILLVMLCGTGIFYTLKLKFIQVRKFKEGLKIVFGSFSLSGKKRDNGEMTPFQAVATAIAAQVGTGNLTGAATALIGGGPGAIFWMWMSAFFGMATIYAEAVLAQKYKTVENGEVTGGPIYYIRQGFKGKFGKVLAVIFACLITVALGFMGNMVQSNSISEAFSSVLDARNLEVSPIIIGLLIAVFSLFVFLGGTKRLASVVEKLVPLMAGIYIVGSLVLIAMHITEVPEAFRMIIVGAFTPRAIVGGAAGITIREAIRYGVARGLFSNEAGMGSTPHAHARAAAKSPHEQGLTAVVSVFIDTFIVLNLTVFSILTTGVLDSGENGIALTQTAFTTGFGGFGDIFVAICLLFFALSTIIGWHFFGAVNVKYLLGDKAVKVYSVIVAICIVIGSTLKLDLVWSLSDFFNGLMVIPNALALWALAGVVNSVRKQYGEKKKEK